MNNPGRTLTYLPFLGEVLLIGTAIKILNAVMMHKDRGHKIILFFFLGGSSEARGLSNKRTLFNLNLSNSIEDKFLFSFLK